MRTGIAFLVLALVLVLTAGAQDHASVPSAASPATRYTLLEGSYFVDDCPVCGRPTILQPMRGTFDVRLLSYTPPFAEYAVRNLDFTASPGFSGEVRIRGEGRYRTLAEFAVLQEMELIAEVQDQVTNRVVSFASGRVTAPQPFPRIEIGLTQTDGTPIQTFGMYLVAAPVREVWFSTRDPLPKPGNASGAQPVGAGDLLSSRGRVVRSNHDLVRHLGVMPVAPDLGLDAVDVIRRGEILFSVEQDIFSETLGPLQHGDLLSDRGRIERRNQDLLAAFGAGPSDADAGLDAVDRTHCGEVLFSIQSDVVTDAGQLLGHGDVLSDQGYVFRTHRRLLEHFHPADTNEDYGVDALWLMPDGEIWFSVEQGFADAWLGPIGHGDVLSDRGHRVFREGTLLEGFPPPDSSLEHGIDALFVVTAMGPARPRPRFRHLGKAYPLNLLLMDWDGEGSVFQVEHADDPAGPWEACSPVLPDLSFEHGCGSATDGAGFYRLRQW